MSDIICYSGQNPVNYESVTVEDFQKDEVAIVKILTAMMDNELPDDLELLNYYKEVPINFKATIDFIDRGLVAAIVHALQAVVMSMQKTTFIKSNHLPHVVLANVQKIRNDTNVAFLSRFSYVNLPAERRRYVRVKVLDRHGVVFKSNQKTVDGKIRDICIGGMAVLAPMVNGLELNAVGVVSVDLGGKQLDVQAKLLRIGDEDGLKKYVFELEIISMNEECIARFVNQQQAEIIKELKSQEMF
jgi:PilZ domain